MHALLPRRRRRFRAPSIAHLPLPLPVAGLLLLAWTAALATTGCRKKMDYQPTPAREGLEGATAITTVSSALSADEGGGSGGQSPPGQWTMPAHDYANTRFSPLSQITADNAKDLKLVWSQPLGTDTGAEAAPLVVGDTMYVVTPFPNKLLAFDLTKPGSGPKWTYEPKPLLAAQGVACCDVVNRGAFYQDGRVYYATLDAQGVAVDAKTGAEVWRTKLGDIGRGETITMAPIVVKGKVLFGNSGGEMGVRGWLTALDANSGAIAWRAYSTGPDKDVLIGDDFHPFYEKDRGKDLGVTTWPKDQWQIGGGTVWGWLSYDPELDLVYYGTANPGPWNPDVRPGDNKYTAGIFARRPEDGRAMWFYQLSPHDTYDHDAVNESVLVDMTIAGKARKVLLHPDRNGYVYVMDRTNGEVLSAVPFVHVNASTGVDLKTGRMGMVEQLAVRTQKVARNICPSATGGKDWQPSSFSPKTQLLYIPHQNLCMDEEGVEANYIAGTPYVGVNVRFRPGPGGNRGAFTAWDPIKGEPRWSLAESFPVWSGAVSTAGDVVFYGTMDGWFKAVNAQTGELLWKHHTESGIISQPISYRGPDGKQYVAVLDGVGGWAGAIVSAGLDTRDQTAAAGWGYVLSDLKKVTKKGGAVYVFALP